MATFSRADRRRSLKALRRPLLLTQGGLYAERIIASFWPVFSLALTCLGALMLGLHETAGLELLWAATVLSALALVILTVRGIRFFKVPTKDEALTRLDASLTGQPIRSLLDGMSVGRDDDATHAVWRAHQARMAQRVATAKAVAPDLNTSRRDPFALRYVALLTFAVALVFGSIWRVGSVSEIVPGSETALAGGPVWEGWIEPPRYTGQPTLYLNDLDAGTLDVPRGTLVSVRMYGEVGALTLTETVSGRTTDVPPASEPAQEFVVSQSGQIEISGPGGRNWQISLLPDTAPKVERTGDLEVSALGEMTLPFRAEDDYGIEAGEARFRLNLGAVERRFGLSVEPEPRADLLAALPIPFTGSRDNFDEVLIEDFSKHPWANLPVTLTLTVLDASEQIGTSEPSSFTLPGRRFFDPMAAAIIEMRRDLLWNRGNTGASAQILRAVTYRPADVFRKETTQLRAKRLIERMETLAAFDLSDETQNQLADEMWDLAIIIEEGDLADALARLERARERLEEAMRNGATQEEIEDLMQELRQATDEYLRQLSRQSQMEAEQNPQNQGQQPDENAMQLTQDDLQRMMDRIQELMEQGRMAEAEQAMRELQELLDNLQMSQNQQGQGQSPGEQAMEGLAETLREQQGLSDQAFRDLQEQFNPDAQTGESEGNEGRNGGQGRGQSHEQSGSQGEGQGSQQGQGQAQSGSEQGDGSSGGGLDQNLADRQRALREELQRQQGSLPGAGTEAGDAARDALDRAGRAMDRAEQNLRNDDYSGAIDNQSQAMDALREGMQNLGEALAEEQRPGQAGQNSGQASGQPNPGQLDPLGRANEQGQGATDSDGNIGIREGLAGRAKELNDEIRRRFSDTSREEAERDYLKRLLDRF